MQEELEGRELRASEWGQISQVVGLQGCITMRASFPSHPYPGVGRHGSGPGKYGDAGRLETGKRNNTSSLVGSSRRVPLWGKLRQAAGLSTVSSRRPG